MRRCICLLILMTSTPLFALKQVIITPFYNASRQKSYDYLSKSITDASRKSLQERFKFSETPRRQWESTLRKNNFIFEREYHSRSVALQNGLLNKQDLVISGYFEVIPTKNQDNQKAKNPAEGNQDVLRNHVYLIDVKRRRILSEFSFDSPINASIFQSVEELAGRISEEAKAILPNKGDYSLGQNSDLKLGILAVNLGINVINLGENNSAGLDRTFSIYNNDFSTAVRPGLEYRYPEFLSKSFSLYFEGELAFAESSLNVNSETEAASASLTGYLLGGGLAFDFELTPNLYFAATFGGGYQLAEAELDLSRLEFPPIDASGNTLTSQTAELNTAYIQTGGRFGFFLSTSLAIEASVAYRHYLSDIYNGQILAKTGFAFHLN